MPGIWIWNSEKSIYTTPKRSEKEAIWDSIGDLDLRVVRFFVYTPPPDFFVWRLVKMLKIF